MQRKKEMSNAVLVGLTKALKTTESSLHTEKLCNIIVKRL